MTETLLLFSSWSTSPLLQVVWCVLYVLPGTGWTHSLSQSWQGEQLCSLLLLVLLKLHFVAEFNLIKYNFSVENTPGLCCRWCQPSPPSSPEEPPSWQGPWWLWGFRSIVQLSTCCPPCCPSCDRAETNHPPPHPRQFPDQSPCHQLLHALRRSFPPVVCELKRKWTFTLPVARLFRCSQWCHHIIGLCGRLCHLLKLWI